MRVLRTLSVASVFAAALAAQASTSIVGSKHNLSVSGPGAIRATSEGELCIFCHAPHNARTQTPLWNREDSRATYLTYQSSTFTGTVSQPNGSTKLCLSCHDGTIALGRVVSQSAEIDMTPGHRFLDSGPAFLGTNLRDDHPVSFHYASSRAGNSPSFKPASAITPPVTLDGQGLMQCTSCHDPHDNRHGNFLRATDAQSALCLSCHTPVDWSTCSHRLSNATWNGTGTNPWPHANYTTVAANACANCHTPHGAGQPARLLQAAHEEDNCLACHDGNVAQKNIRTEVTKRSGHNPFNTLGVHDPAESPLGMARHVECQDCHDPHAARGGRAAAPGVPGPNTAASGLSSSGAPVARITALYELCYKCHADTNSGSPVVPRVLPQTNVRLEFAPGNPSFHPIEATGRNADVPSLLPPLTTGSRVACIDCHQSDSSPDFGGQGPNGPHGSQFVPLLGANYTTTDNTSESPTAYALCYKCHSRSSILGNNSFPLHRKHIVDERAPCSICHDAHGISSTQGNATNNSHLINFDPRSVSISPRDGILRFQDNGRFRGQCTLLCHGEDHRNRNY